MQRYLFDTDIIIDFLRGREEAITFFNTFESDFQMSVISLAELLSGVRSDDEKDDLNHFLSLFTIVALTKDMAFAAGTFRRQYGKSHGMGLADALIAATAQTMGARLVSLNKKHFSMLNFLEVPYRK
jgi:predicted nucleic acid-binding protein